MSTNKLVEMIDETIKQRAENQAREEGSEFEKGLLELLKKHHMDAWSSAFNVSGCMTKIYIDERARALTQKMRADAASRILSDGWGGGASKV